MEGIGDEDGHDTSPWVARWKQAMLDESDARAEQTWPMKEVIFFLSRLMTHPLQ